MTVGIRQLNAMNDMFGQAHRDFKVAQDVGKMMELRRFEFETEVYATAYWENGRRYYLVSKNDKAILGHIHDRALKSALPLPLQTWNERQLVPAGLEEEVEQQVKVNACRHLRDTFPASFWEDASRVSNAPRTSDAFELLAYLAEVIESSFNDDFLALFEDLVDTLFIRRSLTRGDYAYFKEWLIDERQCMAHEIGERDLFSKEMFGFAYRAGNGRINAIVNASQKDIAQRRDSILRDGSSLVTPVFKRKCWYNYDYRLVDVRADFKARVLRLYNDKYFSILEDVEKLPVVVDETEFSAVHARLKEEGNPACIAAWELQGRQWGITW